ncbi:MAG: TlpA disulfide reductase family protein [Sulfuricaulis sp.]|uniref:TlpA family protein disulfide reductase n=1 Tax=Sulfuricaulis sp. TaxID=2003553 RepID=UPI0034A3C9C6
MILLIAAVAALVAGYRLSLSLQSSATTPTTAVAYGGGQAIDFTLNDVEGKNRSLKEWHGQVIVLNFWATWCPPCREEIPLLIKLQQQYAANNLQVIGVAIDNLNAVRSYRETVGMNYPTLLGDDNTMQLIADYGNRSGSLPYTVIIDRHGAIAARKLGIFTRAELESLLDPLLTKTPPLSPKPS